MLLAGLSQRSGENVNALVNRAVGDFLERCDVQELRLGAELCRLKREERELRDTWRLISRSGAYLPQYVDKVVRPQGSPFQLGQVPLRALGKSEEDVFLRIAHRREEIAKRVVEIERVLLSPKKFKPFSYGSKSRCFRPEQHDTYKPVNNVRDEGGEIEHG
jgi:hypothetical protein